MTKFAWAAAILLAMVLGAAGSNPAQATSCDTWVQAKHPAGWRHRCPDARPPWTAQERKRWERDQKRRQHLEERRWKEARHEREEERHERERFQKQARHEREHELKEARHERERRQHEREQQRKEQRHDLNHLLDQVIKR